MKTTRLSPSYLVAILALMLAMGGVGYAAGALPKNSVGTKQLKKNAVTTTKIKDGTVTGADVNESTLSKPGTTGSIILSGYDFRPLSSSTTLGTFGDGDGGVYITGGSDAIAADLAVPAGATVTNIDVYILDSEPLNGVHAKVRSFTPSSGSAADSATTANSGGMSLAVQTITLASDFTVVAGSDYRLYVTMMAATELAVYGAKVDYVYTAKFN